MTRNNNILPIMVALIIGLLLLLSFVGCKTTQPIVQTRDSSRIEYKHDSIYMYKHDSIFRDRWRNGDTVFVTIEKWQTRYKDKLVQIHDTIATTKTETIETKYVPKYYQRTSTGFWILLSILVLIVGFWAVKLYLRIKSGGIIK